MARKVQVEIKAETAQELFEALNGLPGNAVFSSVKYEYMSIMEKRVELTLVVDLPGVELTGPADQEVQEPEQPAGEDASLEA